MEYIFILNFIEDININAINYTSLMGTNLIVVFSYRQRSIIRS
jgi:hypothetical protein